MDQNFVELENVITSAIKRVDNIVYNNVKDLKEGNFKGGEVSVYGLKEDDVGIAVTTKKPVNKDILRFVEVGYNKLK